MKKEILAVCENANSNTNGSNITLTARDEKKKIITSVTLHDTDPEFAKQFSVGKAYTVTISQ